MRAYSKYLILESLLVGLVWQTHCFPTLLHGETICVSDQSGRTGAKVEDPFHLTTNEMDAQAIETSESDSRHFIETIPELYEFKSTVFTDVDQKNAMMDDYNLMKKQLKKIRKKFDCVNRKPTRRVAQYHMMIRASKYSMMRTRLYSMKKDDLDKVSQTINDLDAFQELILKGIKDRIFKMEGQGSRIKEIEMVWIEENGPLNKKAKSDSPSSETSFPRDLCLDLVEQISQKVWDGQVDKLIGILHGFPLLRDIDQRIIKTEWNGLFLKPQNILFQQVSYMYNQKLISGEAFKKFSQSKITLEIAAFNMINIAPDPDAFPYLSAANILNEWTSKCYRSIYEVLDEKNKRYFSYLSLKEFDDKLSSIGSLHVVSLFKEDKLFHMLEDLRLSPSRTSNSRMNLTDLRSHDTDYIKLKESVQELISMFQDSQDYRFKQIRRRKSFPFLYFIQNHYGFKIFGLENSEKFAEKLSLMSSSLQLERELLHIRSCCEERTITVRKLTETRKNEIAEFKLRIFKLLQYLISKHQSLFLDSEMSIYSRPSLLKGLVKYIENSINDIEDYDSYYFWD